MHIMLSCDPEREFDIRDAEEARWLRSRPVCDICGESLACDECVDEDKDGECDECGNEVECTEHIDSDGDEACDVCGEFVPAEVTTEETTEEKIEDNSK